MSTNQRNFINLVICNAAAIGRSSDVSLTGGHRSNFLPILNNPSASRSRLELRWARATWRSPTGAFIGRIQNFVDAAR